MQKNKLPFTSKFSFFPFITEPIWLRLLLFLLWNSVHIFWFHGQTYFLLNKSLKHQHEGTNYPLNILSLIQVFVNILIWMCEFSIHNGMMFIGLRRISISRNGLLFSILNINFILTWTQYKNCSKHSLLCDQVTTVTLYKHGILWKKIFSENIKLLSCQTAKPILAAHKLNRMEPKY